MKQKAFTLIELLVVIAIIGLLSSVVLVNMKGLREKANITKGLEFSQTIQSALGAEAVGVWTFDDCSAKDSSGYGNNGTINGAVCTADTPYAAVGQGSGKNALSFNGAGDYVGAGGGNSLEFSNAITVEAWLFVKSRSTDWIHAVGNGNGYWFDLWGAAEQKIGFVVNTGGNYVAGPVPMSNNVWHHVVGVANDSDKSLKLYIDGKPAASGNYSGTVSIGGSFTIGAYPGRYMGGLIDEVRVYNKALTSAEIQKHYAEGSNKHQSFAER